MSASLNNIVDVTVNVSNPSVISSNFNLGLIIGKNTVISTQDRVRRYTYNTYTDQMIADGFKTTDPLYLAVQAYFSQQPVSNAVLIGTQGSSESLVSAITACRAANENFFGFTFAEETTDSNIAAVAQAVEGFTIPTYFFFSTKDSNCLAPATANILDTLKKAGYNYTCGSYSTKPYFTSALLGLFSGLNSMQANSAYSMAYKTLVGIVPENLTNAQLNALESYNGNAYISVGSSYQLLMNGVSSSGYHIDEIYFICAAKFLIQENTVAGLVNRRKVPQTESGLADIINYISRGCYGLASIGMIGSGIWNGETIMGLNAGDAISGGYKIMSGTMAEQSAADRAARRTPPIYVCLKGTGAIEHVVIQVSIDR